MKSVQFKNKMKSVKNYQIFSIFSEKTRMNNNKKPRNEEKKKQRQGGKTTIIRNEMATKRRRNTYKNVRKIYDHNELR